MKYVPGSNASSQTQSQKQPDTGSRRAPDAKSKVEYIRETRWTHSRQRGWGRFKCVGVKEELQQQIVMEKQTTKAVLITHHFCNPQYSATLLSHSWSSCSYASPTVDSKSGYIELSWDLREQQQWCECEGRTIYTARVAPRST